MINKSSGVLLVLAVCIIAPVAFPAGRNGLSISSISPTQRVLTITSDRSSVSSLVSAANGGAPYVAFPFIASGSVSYSVTRTSPDVVTLDAPLPATVDTAEGLPGIAHENLSVLTSPNGTTLRQVGIMRGQKVFSLIVVPYVYNRGARQLTYFRNITVSLTSSQPFPEQFDNPAEAISQRIVNKVQSSGAPPSGSCIRIIVNKDGIYHITTNDLDTSHVDISGFTSQNMTLWNHGKQIPIYVHTTGGINFTGDSYFEFYGTANRVDYSDGRPDLYADPFTDNNIYILTDDSTALPQRLVTESGALNRYPNAVDLTGYSFTQTVHLEQDLRFERLDNVDTNETYDRRDHWFWTEASSNHMVTVPFALAWPDTTSIQPLTLKAAFHGITHLDGDGGPNVPNENQAELFINQTHVLSTTWDSQTLRLASVGPDANIPQSVLHNGSNNLQIFDANPGNIAVATFAFNWMELNYQRLYVADQDYLKFSIPDNAQPGYYNFLIQNFRNSSISVYRLNASRITDVTIQFINNLGTAPGYAASFQVYVQSPDEQLIAVSDAGKLKPVKIEQVPNAALSSYDYSADYIIIASRQLDDITKGEDPSNPVTQLADYYQTHGMKTLVVDGVQVYDDFNYGIKSPYAIRNFLSYAYHNWSVAPKYVLLVGRGSWDTKNGHDATNLIPVMLVQTYQFGATSADNFYATIDGDDPLPDIAVGRIPAQTSDQLKAAISKILSYYSNKTYGWQNNTLLIAGEENDFHVQTESIVRSMVPPHVFTERLYTSIQDTSIDPQYYGTTQDLISYFNKGASLINYMGHGGGAIWADNGILTNDAVATMSNSGKYPFVLSMTCFAGAFDGQEGVPLSSTLLFAQNKGAVGVVASAGLGWLLNDFYMDSELLPLVFDTTRSDVSIGYDLMIAKGLYYAAYSPTNLQAYGMVSQYNFLGDPALVVQIPKDSSYVRLDSYVASPESNVTGSVLDGPAGGTGTVVLTDQDGNTAAQTNITLDNSGQGSFNIPFVGGFSGLGHAKTYLHNSSTQVSSSVDFTTSGNIAQIGRFGITANGAAYRISVGVLAGATSGITSVQFSGRVYASKNRTADSFIASLNIPLTLNTSNEYSADVTIGGDTLKPGDVIVANAVATLSARQTFSSPTETYTVPGAADLSAYSQGSSANINSTIAVVADTTIRLESLVYDLNSVPAENVRVDFYDGARNGAGVLLGSARVSFDTTWQQLASLPVNLTTGSHRIYIYLVIDSLTDGFDIHPENDYASSVVNIDFTRANSSGVVSIDSTATLSGLTPGSIFQVERLSPGLYPQPFIIPARNSESGITFCEFVSLKNSQSGNYSLSLKIYDPDSTTRANLTGLRLYIYDTHTRTLNLVGGNYAAGSVSGSVTQLGAFVAAFSSDNTPPQVNVSVGDQFFTDGDYVPPNPRLSFIIHDEDGINLARNKFGFTLDSQKLDTSLIILPDTVTNPTSVTATVQLPLTNGSHTLVMTAQDANGNISSPLTVNFAVRSDFSLRVYGSYPDPFASETFIAFDITSPNPIDAVQVKIYSVSGRLVKTIQYPSNDPNQEFGLLRGGTGTPTAVGYHEAWWDGTDNFENQVANGVYFYKVSVSSGGKTIDDIGKLARLR